MLGNESRARAKFLAENYADRNSVLAILPALRGEENEELVKQVLSRLESKNPNYAPLLKGNMYCSISGEVGADLAGLKFLT